MSRKSVNNDRGVSYNDFYSKNAKRSNVSTPNEARGVPVGAGAEFRVPEESIVKSCDALTKRGTVCKARPVGGSSLCAGHRRQAEALHRG